MEKNRSAIIEPILRELLHSGPALGEEQARLFAQRILSEGEEALVFLFLEIARRVNQSAPSPSTPSGMIPPHLKASAQTGKQPRKKKKAGGQKGHPGHNRRPPDHIDRREEHRLDRCPNCGGPLQRCHGPRSIRIRIVEDLPESLAPEVTEHRIHRDYCPRCQKPVEPKVEDALTHSRIGHRLLVLTAYWHYALGITLAQIRDTLDFHLRFPWSKGGMIRQWHALRQILLLWYETLIAEIRHSAVLHADETGWRVNGVTHWLWCFTTGSVTVYLVDRSRGSPALKRIFDEAFEGILVTDFWAAYDAILGGLHQCCLFHLLNELVKVDQRNLAAEWQAFARKTKRLIQDALRLRARADFTPERYAARIERLYERLLDLALARYTDADARRLANRLEKYRDELFTFLSHPEVPATNNHGEHEVRSAVLIRKIIYGNRSDEGALTQGVLMSIFRTLKRRGYNPIATLVAALREYVRTGHLPPFPPVITSEE